MKVKSNILLRPLAQEDLINIWLHTYSNWGDRQADSYLDGLQSAFEYLSDNPLVCREREEFNPAVRIYNFEEHIVVYQIDSSCIDVIRVLHKSMDIESQID